MDGEGVLYALGVRPLPSECSRVEEIELVDLSDSEVSGSNEAFKLIN